jgi:hypothetical protein
VRRDDDLCATVDQPGELDDERQRPGERERGVGLVEQVEAAGVARRPSSARKRLAVATARGTRGSPRGDGFCSR